MNKDLCVPEFLKEDADTIHNRMLDKAPPNVSTIEGDYFYDCTRPTAEEKAELVQMQLQNILRLAFPQTSYGVYLEYLGECKGVFKNPPTNSTGTIKFIGKSDTVINKGTIVSTPATEEKEPIEFEIIETKTIDDSEQINIKAKCLKPGTIGNILKGNINVLITAIDGIKEICNEDDLKGGTDIEDEEHFRERVLEEYKNEATSGNEEHYKKWAKEVEGVGFADVQSEWNGPGTVKVLILDKNNKTATKELIDKVQNYIAPIVPKGKNRGGKAPVCAAVTIDTPSTLEINIKAKFNFKNGFAEETILNNLKDKISNYLSTLSIGGIILYNAIHTIVGSMILTNEGIEDFNNLTINDTNENIILKNQVAVIGEVVNVK